MVLKVIQVTITILQVFITVTDGKYEVTNDYIIKLQNVNDNVPEILHPLQSEIINVVDGDGNKIKIHVILVILVLILRSIANKIHTCSVNVKQLLLENLKPYFKLLINFKKLIDKQKGHSLLRMK